MGLFLEEEEEQILAMKDKLRTIYKSVNQSVKTPMVSLCGKNEQRKKK